MRNNATTQLSNYRKILFSGSNNEILFFFLIMIVIFFVNLYCIIKNNVINTIYNILKRTFTRLISSTLFASFLKQSELHNNIECELKHCEKSKEFARFNNNKMCYICLNSIELEVMAGCFHSFCGNCIILYWRSQNNFQIKCPACRRAIKMLHFNEPLVGTKEAENINFNETIKALYEYNYHFSQEKRTWKEVLLDFPFLWKRTLFFLFSREGIQFFVKTVESNLYLIILILYVLSPFDIIPECIFGFIGLIDDLFILILIFIILTNYYYQYICARDSKRYRSFLDY